MTPLQATLARALPLPVALAFLLPDGRARRLLVGRHANRVPDVGQRAAMGKRVLALVLAARSLGSRLQSSAHWRAGGTYMAWFSLLHPASQTMRGATMRDHFSQHKHIHAQTMQ
jgi:hypothetical protein